MLVNMTMAACDFFPSWGVFFFKYSIFLPSQVSLNKNSIWKTHSVPLSCIDDHYGIHVRQVRHIKDKYSCILGVIILFEVLVNCLGGLSLPRKSVVRLTGRPDMTLDVYCGRKTTIQQQPIMQQSSDTANQSSR